MQLPKVDHIKRTVTFKGGYKLLSEFKRCPICKKDMQLCKAAATRWTWKRCSYCLVNLTKEQP